MVVMETDDSGLEPSPAVLLMGRRAVGDGSERATRELGIGAVVNGGTTIDAGGEEEEGSETTGLLPLGAPTIRMFSYRVSRIVLRLICRRRMLLPTLPPHSAVGSPGQGMLQAPCTVCVVELLKVLPQKQYLDRSDSYRRGIRLLTCRTSPHKRSWRTQ